MTEKDNICARMSELFFDYLEHREDGETEELAELRRHLEGCEACRRELEECERMLLAVKASEAEPPEGLRLGVMTAVKAEAKAYRRRRLLRSVSGAAAAVAVFAGVAVMLNAFGFGVKFDAPASGNMNDAIGDRVDAEDAAPDGADKNYGDFFEDIFGGDNAADEGENFYPNGGMSPDEDDVVPGVPEGDGDAPEDEDGGVSPETGRTDGFYYSDTVPDRIADLFYGIAAAEGCNGGVLVTVSGERKDEAMLALAAYLDSGEENGALVVSYELLEKAETALQRVAAKYEGTLCVGYRLSGDKMCIVIAAE